jgi:hypothetical protein
VLTSSVAEPRIATGITPAAVTLNVFSLLPGLATVTASTYTGDVIIGEDYIRIVPG